MLSIIVSWLDRQELGKTLPGLVESSKAVNGDLTIVNFGGSCDMLRDQIGEYHSLVNVVQVEPQLY